MEVLKHIQTHQRDNKILIAQLLAGHQRICHPIKKSYQINQCQVEAMVGNYQVYKECGEIRNYLKALSYRNFR